MVTALPEEQSTRRWQAHLRRCRTAVERPVQFCVEGKLTRMVGLTLEAVGCQAPIGGRCLIVSSDKTEIEAEVVGFSGDKTFLMPTGDIRGLVPNSRVIPTGRVCEAPVGEALLGRVIDGVGKCLDSGPPLRLAERMPLAGKSVNPLSRRPITQPLDVGVRAINALLTVGRGQRMGLFAGSGVGKSVLLGMMTRFTEADVIVVGLIGERGREVKDFIENILGEDGLARSVVVATPADNPPLLRLHGAMLATSVAEYFRDRGKNVLLLMDSLTRFAHAQREVALAVGEPPATKGYPPSVFAKLPQLVERSGNGGNGTGSITAFYTVLAEGDDHQDPVADAARAVLDGHIVLTRELGDKGHYPAIDIEASVSRLIPQVASEKQQEQIKRFRQLYSTYHQNRDLLNVGAYSRGTDPQVDEAIASYPRLIDFLKQGMHESVPFGQSVEHLSAVVAGIPA